MPRQSRKSSGTGIYHVMMRGINHQNIFEEQEDYYQFLNIPARGQVPDIRTIVIRLGSWARAPKRSGKGKLRASTAKRLGEDSFFSGAFVVFCRVSAIFRIFCLVILRYFVYLQAE